MPGQIGNKGGGRKSAYQERQNATWAFDVWNDPTVYAELKKRIDSGVFAAKDIYLFKLMSGSEALMKDLGSKIMADLHDHALELKEYVITRGITEADSKSIQSTPNAAEDN